MNRHGFYMAAFNSNSEPTPGVGDVILCPPSTGVSVAKIIKVIRAAMRFQDGTSLDLVIGMEAQ